MAEKEAKNKLIEFLNTSVTMEVTSPNNNMQRGYLIILSKFLNPASDLYLFQYGGSYERLLSRVSLPRQQQLTPGSARYVPRPRSSQPEHGGTAKG